MKIDLAGQLAALDRYTGFYDGGHNNNPFGPWQGVGNGAAWCDSSAQYGACVGGGFDGWDTRCQFVKKGSAYVPFTIGDAQRIGLWRAKGSGYVPQPGDQEIYDWEHNGVADHIAARYIAKRPDGTHVTWEGNHNDRAGYVVRDDKYVLGWVALSSVATAPAPVPIPPLPTGDDMAPNICVHPVSPPGAGIWLTCGKLKSWLSHPVDPQHNANLGLCDKDTHGNVVVHECPEDWLRRIANTPGRPVPAGWEDVIT